jgi:hypothetical protein
MESFSACCWKRCPVCIHASFTMIHVKVKLQSRSGTLTICDFLLSRKKSYTTHTNVKFSSGSLWCNSLLCDLLHNKCLCFLYLCCWIIPIYTIPFIASQKVLKNLLSATRTRIFGFWVYRLSWGQHRWARHCSVSSSVCKKMLLLLFAI